MGTTAPKILSGTHSMLYVGLGYVLHADCRTHYGGEGETQHIPTLQAAAYCLVTP